MEKHKTNSTNESSIDQKLIVYFTIATSLINSPTMLSLILTALILISFIAIFKFKYKKQFHEVKKGIKVLNARIRIATARYKKRIAISLQLTVVIIFSFFVIIATLLWVNQLINPIDVWKFYFYISLWMLCGAYTAWSMLYVINDPIEIDRRILKLVKSKI